MRSRFDSIQYDVHSQALKDDVRLHAVKLESVIEQLPGSREKWFALSKLEEVVMWAGKAIRDDQLSRVPTSEVLKQNRPG